MAALAAAGVGLGANALMGNNIMKGEVFGKDLSPKDPWANRLRPVKTAKEMLKADVAALRTPGALGLTEAQIQEQTRAAQEAAQAGVGAQAADLARTALAGQGFQAGAIQQGTRQLGQATGEAAAKASQSAYDASRRIQEREAARIRKDLDAQRERARENVDKWLDFGVKATPMVARMIMGFIGGGLPAGGGAFSLGGALEGMGTSIAQEGTAEVGGAAGVTSAAA